ncbi:MAG: multiprotein-bridging factor 1 family protein [Halodesulfurarchaeum sp.]
MAKYSTGGTDRGGDGGTCELCGTATDDLERVTVEGATLSVCGDCAALGEGRSGESSSGNSGADGRESRGKRAARNTAKAMDAVAGDSTHWEEEGTEYETDRLPYLVSDYGDRVLGARQEAGYQREELADELGIDENELLAVEQGRATSASVGGSVIRALETELDVDLIEE